ncbi:MAG: tetratricopeptide repeat protein [Candidatus Aminicenantes bacterium]|nr:tetratricopeptide repeat protein [Candidatus Aminicenantes bacterium]
MTGFRKSSLVLICSIILASSWGFSQTEEANRILGQAGGSVLTIIGYGADKAEIANSRGSALALAEDVVVTAYHVIAQAFDVEAVNFKGKKVKIEGVLGVDKANDIVLLKLKGKAQPLPIGTTDNLAVGARLFALGSNNLAKIIISEGTLRRVVDMGAGVKILDVAMASAPDEFRGGPLLDVNGQLVGMLLVLGDRGFKFGLPVGAMANVSRTGKVVEFKSWTQENYFETVEGNIFAGRAAAALDDQMTARLYLEKAVKLNPNYLDGYVKLADIYAKQRDYTAAAEAYKKVTDLDASRADAFYGMGSVLTRQMKFKEAAEALEKAVALNVANKEAQFDLGTAYEELQEYDKAARAYEKFIALAPAVAGEAYLHLGICRTKLGQFDAAIAALLEAQKAQPKDTKVNFSLAEAYEKAGQFEKAEAVYIILAGINPAEAKTYYRQSFRIYDVAGKYDLAITPAKKIIELEPNNEMNHYYLGLTYFKLQKYDEAIAAFQQGLAVKPDFAHAWFQIGSAYFNQKKYNESAAAYKKYAELAPDDPSGWLSIGVCYMQLKNHEAALEPLKKCVDLKPDNPVAWFNLAIVYINLKDFYSAKEVYNRLVTLDPSLAERLKKYLR